MLAVEALLLTNWGQAKCFDMCQQFGGSEWDDILCFSGLIWYRSMYTEIQCLTLSEISWSFNENNQSILEQHDWWEIFSNFSDPYDWWKISSILVLINLVSLNAYLV